MAHERDGGAVYVISVAASLAGVHPQTLRIYERKGLLKPYRTAGGTRRYSNQDLARLRLITELTGEGVNLEGVRRIIELQEEMDELLRRMEALQRQMVEADAQARRRLEELRRSYRTEMTLARRHLPDVVRPLLEDLLS
ncbi:MAG: helix-turn-helix transcriptional regulator [Actinomycetota bacterium]|nr:helix-turn-helix transcriptional regulator [Actinomycetota bacterium]